MSQIANIAYTEYLRKLIAMRAAVVALTQAIVNKASTNPPSKGKKQKLLDAVYLEHNKDQQLVVWSYGPGGKACMGPHYPTAEAYPLQAFVDRMLFMMQVDKEANTRGFANFINKRCQRRKGCSLKWRSNLPATKPQRVCRD